MMFEKVKETMEQKKSNTNEKKIKELKEKIEKLENAPAEEAAKKIEKEQKKRNALLVKTGKEVEKLRSEVIETMNKVSKSLGCDGTFVDVAFVLKLEDGEEIRFPEQ